MDVKRKTDRFTDSDVEREKKKKKYGAKVERRVDAILTHRPPRSVPELASRLATLQYYQNFLPLMKRLAIPLYKV